MRVREILEDAEANWPIIAQRIAKGDWRGAILMGALSNKKELYPYLNDDQKRVLNYAVNTYGAASFWEGLSAFAARVGVPFLALAGWSGKLNKGEDEELAKLRIADAEWSFAP